MRAARPLYPGHDQPVVPADLGYYDLRDARVRAEQADLARTFGITAFCYWHYWFAGRRVLDLAFREVLDSGQPELPFCLGWANQSWTGVWHGAPGRVLIEQTYPGGDDHRRHFATLVDAFCDPRYLRIEDRPVFYVQDPWAIPAVESWAGLWQRLARRAGLPGLFLVGEYRGGLWQPQHHGFDGSVAIRFPATEARPRWPSRRAGRGDEGPVLVDYDEAQLGLTSLEDDEHFPCVVPRWDHTPRSGSRGLVLRGSTPELFRLQVERAARKAMGLEPGRRLLWVKSWNEWAEGNMLEPETRFGRGYLEALQRGVEHPAATRADAPLATRRRPRAAPARPPLEDWWRGSGRRRLGLSKVARRWAERGGPLGHPPATTTTVPVVLCVECEPDVPEPDFPAGVESIRATIELFGRWRDEAARATGTAVRLVWLVGMHALVDHALGDPAAILDRLPGIVSGAEDTGDVLGVLPRAIRRDPDSGLWLADRTSPALASEALQSAVDSFSKVVGDGPAALRFGDGILSTRLVAEEEEAGVRHDLTLEPGRRPAPGDGSRSDAHQATPDDWARVPRLPYLASRADYRRPLLAGTRPLRMVPMTTGSRWLGGSPLPRLRAVRAYGLARWKQRDLLDMASPNWTGPDGFREVLLRTLAVQEKPFLSFCVRTDWVSRPDHRRNVERGLAALLSLSDRYKMAFMTPDEACHLL